MGKDRSIEVVVSEFILSEVLRVLQSKFGKSALEAQVEIDDIRAWATIVEPTTQVRVVATDPNDNPILECCLECGADYLVTGDRRDLLPLGSFRGTTIVTGADFLRILEREEEAFDSSP